MGPNVKALIARRASLILIPPGCPDPLGVGLNAFTDPDAITTVMREATEWVYTAIALVKNAPDNPHGEDDEDIAEAILEQIATSTRKGLS